MSVGSDTDILILSNIQAKALAGSLLAIGDEIYRLKDYDREYPGQPPWRSGAEGKAYPLLGRDGSVVAYLKFFTRPTLQRLNRTAWLIGQQMHTWLPGLAAAPLLWVDTRLSFRSSKIDFDFAGYLAQAVSGETWLELKNRLVEASDPLPEDFRRRCVEDLVLAGAVLERAGIVHGDLSPNNIVIDRNASPEEPALYLIDFDAFVAPSAGSNQAVAVADGGTYGTEGYCPPDLAARAEEGDGSAAPYSDRYGRDMLILELLFMDSALPPDDPPAKWNRARLQQLAAAWRESCDPARRRIMEHLKVPEVFSLPEDRRPTSMQLAAALELELPESPAICDVQISQSLTMLSQMHSVPAHVTQRIRRRPVQRPIRQALPAKQQPLSRWVVSARIMPPRKHRRFRKSASAPEPKNDPRELVILIAIMVLLWLVPLIIILLS
jgi:hypothetical protein